MNAVTACFRTNVVHGIAHITGGGLLENLERILPANVTATIQRDSWDVLPVFDWIRDLGEIEEDEMDRVFNMGIGFVLVLDPYYVESVQRRLDEMRTESWVIGRIEAGETGFLAPIRSPESIAEHIKWFLRHREELPRMAKRAKDKASSYLWSAYAKALVQFCLREREASVILNGSSRKT